MGRSVYKRAPVLLASVLCDNRRALRLNESALDQFGHIFAYRVRAHIDGFTNRFVACMALIRRPILNVHQIAVDRQRARREAEGENLIRQRKVVFDWIARRVILIPHARLPSAAPPRDETAPSVRQAGCRSAAMGNRPRAEARRRLTAKRPARGRQAAR